MALTKVQKEGIETLINNNADNRVITGSGTANTLEGESNFSYDGTKCLIGTSTGAPYANRNLTVAQGGSGNTTVAIEVRSPTDGDGRIVFTDSTSDEAGAYKGQIRYDQSSDFMSFNTNGDNERLRIDSSGKVGISTTSPNTLLHIQDAAISGYSSQSSTLLALEDSGDTSLEIASGHNNTGSIFFGDTGSSNKGQINYLHGTGGDAMSFHANGSERMRINSAGNVGIGTTSPDSILHCAFSSGTTAPTSGTTPKGIAQSYGGTDNHWAGLWFSADFGGDQGISGIAGTRTSGYETDLRFYTNNTGSARAFSERMRINSAGDVFIGTTTTNPGIGNYQTPGTMIRAGDGDYIAVSRAQNCPLFLNRDDSTGTLISLRYNATERGTIQTDGTNVVYNTSSDYRLKENVVNLTGAIDRLKTLLPKRFNFKELPSKTVDGFLAHEVSSIVPEAITGTKDEVATTDDATRGIKKGDPIYQGIDQSKLVPLLTAALQEAIAKIEVLETKVAALEAT